MKTCPNCQNPVNDGELFCPNCGTKVDAQQTPNVSAQQPSFNQSYEQPNNNQQQYNQQNYNQQQYNQHLQQGRGLAEYDAIAAFLYGCVCHGFHLQVWA